jgi:hypothetical protein
MKEETRLKKSTRRLRKNKISFKLRSSRKSLMLCIEMNLVLESELINMMNLLIIQKKERFNNLILKKTLKLEEVMCLTLRIKKEKEKSVRLKRRLIK